MRLKLLLLFLLTNILAVDQDKNYTSQNIAVNTLIDGTLLTPNSITKPNLVIIIAGSGPTDRDGNQNFLKNNALKKLAIGLTEKNIATFRYDKRIVKQIRKGRVDNNILFDDFVTDAISTINYFKKSTKFNKIYIAGHSQGSLVGILAAKDKADGFISLAGAGQSMDKVILEQIALMDTRLVSEAETVFNILKEGKTTNNYPQALASIFNKEVQSFMSSWIRYDPQEEIKRLNMPILIINGTKDLQVGEKEANLLKEKVPKATLKIIDKMNHILVPIEGDTLENSKSYNEAYRKISPELFEAIVNFIN